MFPCYVCVKVLQASACMLGGQGAATTDLLMAVIWAYLAYKEQSVLVLYVLMTVLATTDAGQ